MRKRVREAIPVKRLLTISLILVLVLGLAGTAMAGTDKTKRNRVDASNRLRVEGEDLDEAEENEAEEEDDEEPEEDEGDEEEGPSQGAVHCLLTIDYTIPGNGTGSMTLVAKRGSIVETFEAEIPWGLTDEEAMAYILEAFAPVVKEAFGLEVNSFKVLGYEFDQETSITTAELVAIHGKAPVRLPKAPKGASEQPAKASSHGHEREGT